MANLIEKTIEVIVGGIMGGVLGYVTDIIIGAMLDAFKSFNLAIALLAVAYPILSFVLALKEAYATGIFFSLGIIFAGLLVKDTVTIILGFVSVIGLVAGSLLDALNKDKESD